MERCKTCKTCKHWGHEDADDYHGFGGIADVRVCSAVPMFWDSTEWDVGKRREGRCFSDDVTATAFAQDGSDYKAYLYTLADHGCTMHVQKGE